MTEFDEDKWVQERFGIVVAANREKFGQHKALQEFLMNTGDRVLVEASPFDRIWGIGMRASDSNAEKPDCWSGLNLLGFALMEVRAQMQEASP